MVMQYISNNPKIVNAVQFLGEEIGMPSFVSVRGTSLDIKDRVAEFYNKIHESYLRAKYGEWILFLDNGDRWPCTDEMFRSSYSVYQPKEPPHTPVMDGANLPFLGFR